MIPRQILTALVFALPVLVVAFGVLMGGSVLAQAVQDSPGSVVLRWIAIGVLLLMVTDIVLLVGALGIKALGDQDDHSDSSGG